MTRSMALRRIQNLLTRVKIDVIYIAFLCLFGLLSVFSNRQQGGAATFLERRRSTRMIIDLLRSFDAPITPP